MIQSETLHNNHKTACKPLPSPLQQLQDWGPVRAVLSQGSASVTTEATPVPIPTGVTLWKAEGRSQDLPGQWVPSKHSLLGKEGQQALPTQKSGNGK